MSTSKSAIQQALCRTDMPKGQVTLLKYLYESDKRLSTEELADGIRGGDVNSCTSILGPFTQRINNTPEISGSPGYKVVINKRRHGGETFYELTKEGRKAIDDTPRLLKEFKRDMDVLRAEANPVIEQNEFGI